MNELPNNLLISIEDLKEDIKKRDIKIAELEKIIEKAVDVIKELDYQLDSPNLRVSEYAQAFLKQINNKVGE
jgi:5'(3')-deoxyribonucleotidase